MNIIQQPKQVNLTSKAQKGTWVNCTWCGKEKKVKPSRANREKIFCSTACYHEHKARNRFAGECSYCGVPISKPPSQVRERNFCSVSCSAKVNNPEKNKTLMTPEVRGKLRAAHLGKGEGKAYPKIFGRHAHRVIAEMKLGRPLRRGEIVHHIDEDILNYHPDNLEILFSQSEHAKYHQWGRKK